MEKDFVRINFVGDICLKNIDDNTYSFSEGLANYLKQADLNVANLECSITRSENPLKYQPIHLKAEPIRTRVFDLFDVYSLANNHTMDYGIEGLQDTIQFLEGENKSYFGAGMNLEDALKPLTIVISGLKLAFFSFNRFNTAKKNLPGTAPEKIRRICNNIKDLKQKGFFIIVVPHWNYQWVDYPAPDERRKGYDMIKAGADIVVGAHPHIVQGYENYNGKMIFHSLGNFVFRNTKYTKQIAQFGQTFVLTININKKTKSYTFDIYPVYNDNNGARFMDEKESEEFNERLNRISEVLSDKWTSHLLFYKSGKNIEKNNKFVFSELNKDNGIRAILENYKIANWQDVKRKIFTLLFK